MADGSTTRLDAVSGTPADGVAPQDGRYARADIPVYLLRCLVATLEDLGIGPARLTQGLGLSLSDLADPVCRVSFRQGREMIRRALELGKGHALGLETGSRETIASIGLVGYAMITSPSVGAAIALGLALQKDTGSMLEFDTRTQGSAVAVSASSRFHAPDITVFLVEEAFASFLMVGRGLVGDRFRPMRVDLAYPAPAHAGSYGEVFGCEIRFGTAENLFVYDAAWYAKPLTTSNPLSHREVMNHLELDRARHREAQEIIHSVERALRRNLPEPPACERVARELGLSERTLRRRLAEFGTSFQILLDGQRRNRALELLSNTRMGTAEIAAATGFADARNFRRAFRRWTGTTPGALRRDALGIWPDQPPHPSLPALWRGPAPG